MLLGFDTNLHKTFNNNRSFIPWWLNHRFQSYDPWLTTESVNFYLVKTTCIKIFVLFKYVTCKIQTRSLKVKVTHRGEGQHLSIKCNYALILYPITYPSFNQNGYIQVSTYQTHLKFHYCQKLDSDNQIR